MKVRTYGALMGALLTITSVEAAEAAAPATSCVPTPQTCAPAPAKPVVHRAPAIQQTRDDSGLAYAQSGYNYRSASRVTEFFVRNSAPARVPAPVVRPPLQNEGWQVSPNDAHIHFYRDEREVIVPGGGYPQSYDQQSSFPQSYYAPPPPPAYGYPEPPPGVDLGEQQGFNGGVGYGGEGSGGGFGGSITLFMNNGSGGSDEPPNGGGENLPAGYGPTYRGGFQGPVPPTRGGLSGH